MQNEFISVVSSRPTLGKIESTPQIGYALGKVCVNAILNHKRKYKKWLRDQNYAQRGSIGGGSGTASTATAVPKFDKCGLSRTKLGSEQFQYQPVLI